MQPSGTRSSCKVQSMGQKVAVVVLMLYQFMCCRSGWAENPQWTRLGPEGGSITTFSIDPRDPNVLYAGTEFGSFASGDGGRSWVRSAITMPNANLFFNPQDPNVVYARPGQLNQIGRLLKSTDRGKNWKEAAPPEILVGEFVMSLQDPNTMIIAGVRGVFKSNDGGENWLSINSGLPSLYVQTLLIDPQNHDKVYVGTRAGVFKSIDGGKTWQVIREGATRFALAVDPKNSDTIYVAPFNEPTLKSTDGGKTWTTSKVLLPTPVFTLTVDPQDPLTIYACCAPPGLETGLWKSTDGGETWTDAGLKGLQTFAFDPQNPAIVYAGTDRGVFKSTDRGKSWNDMNSGMAAAQTRVLAVDPQDPKTVFAAIGAKRQVSRSTDGGVNWTAVTGLSPNNWYAMAIHPKDSRIMYAAGSNGLFKSLDGGETWGALGPAASYGAVALDPQNSDMVYVGSWHPDSQVFKSSDGGNTWLTPTSTFTEYDRTGGKICTPGVSSLTVDSQNSNNVYVALSDCNDQVESIWRSTDGGINWERTNASGFGPVVADPQKAETVYAGTYAGGGILKSTDGGQHWNVLKSGLPAGFAATTLAIDPQTSDTLYAAGYLSYYPVRSSAVFKSIDGGTSWFSFDDGLNNPNIDSLVLASKGPNTLYGASSYGGLFKIFDNTPVVSIVASQYCVGDPWNLRVSNGASNASVRLLGTSNGQSWEVLNWRKADANGAWNEAGRFITGMEGGHDLWVDIGGTLSNVVSFVVSSCSP